MSELQAPRPDSRRGSRGPRANPRSPRLGKSRQVRTRQRSARADHRAKGSGVLHTPAPLVWCKWYLLTLSPRDPPRRSRPEPASPWGSRPQTDEIPAKTSAFKEGGATEKPAPGGALARSLRDPSALLKFSREFSSPGLRKAICVFTFLIFFPPFGSFNWYFGPEGGTSLKKETG